MSAIGSRQKVPLKSGGPELDGTCITPTEESRVLVLNYTARSYWGQSVCVQAHTHDGQHLKPQILLEAEAEE